MSISQNLVHKKAKKIVNEKFVKLRQVEEESAQIADDKKKLLMENEELRKNLTNATETIRNMTVTTGLEATSGAAADEVEDNSDSGNDEKDMFLHHEGEVTTLKNRIIELTQEIQHLRDQVRTKIFEMKSYELFAESCRAN